MIDRSMFYDELRRDPALITRLNTIVNGEAGHNARPEVKAMYLETIFNRATAQNKTLAEVTRSVDGRFNADGSGRRGYYPTATMVNGVPRSQNEANSFNEQVMKPVLAGSDILTEKVGFPATGNASEGNTHFASTRAAKGLYQQYKWYDTGNGREMFVHEQADNLPRLYGYRTGERPTPPADIPMTDAQYAAQGPNTRGVQAVYPGYQPPPQVGVEGTSDKVPMPYARGQTASGTASVQPAPQYATGAPPLKTVGEAPGRDLFRAVKQAFAPQRGGGGLGDAMIGAMGPRGANMSTFSDPTTGQTYLQGGSGEEAMNPYRAIGGRTSFTARPAPAPLRSAPQPNPPGQGGAAAVNPQRGPVPPSAEQVPLPRQRPAAPLAPFDPTTFDKTPMANQPTDTLTASGVPMVEDPVGTLPLSPLDVKQFMVQQPPERPGIVDRVTSYFDRNPPMWTAPEEAGLLAAQSPQPVITQRPSINPQPAPVSWPTTDVPPVSPPYVPTTTGQQLGGLSPFSTTGPQNNFPSATILPFDQWPPVGWGFAGPSSFDFGAWG